MVKRTLELFECDLCGEEGQRYQIVYSDGTRILDRCARHAKKLESFREEAGEWLSDKQGKATFRKSTPADLRLALARGTQKSSEGYDEGKGSAS